MQEITERQFHFAGHDMFALTAGPSDGPLIVFVHGWPELSLSWRDQLPALAALGFYCVAPDMRGYGRSSVYDRHQDYALEALVGDLRNLLNTLERDAAVWVGHDWGSPVVWSLAAHYPQLCQGVASLCVPYYTLERGLDAVVALVNRDIYPAAQYPAGQWEYMRFYEENFAAATAAFEQDPYKVVKLLFRKGDPAGFGQPTGTAMVRHNGGWFGGGAIPDLPIDTDVIDADALEIYAQGLKRNGFFGPDSYYMNHARNGEYALTAVNGGHLSMPVLFLAAQYDYTCETITSDLAKPMREYCANLTEQVVYSGHWMAQEKPLDVNAQLVRWLVSELGDLFPMPVPGSGC